MQPKASEVAMTLAQAKAMLTSTGETFESLSDKTLNEIINDPHKGTRHQKQAAGLIMMERHARQKEADDAAKAKVKVKAQADSLPAAPAEVTPPAAFPPAPKAVPDGIVRNRPPSDDEFSGFEDDGFGDPGIYEPTPPTAITIHEPTSIKSSAGDFLKPNEVPDLETMTPSISLTLKRHEFSNVGEEFRGVYVGQTTFSKEGKPFLAAMFQRKDGVYWLTGEHLIQQVKNLPTKTPVLVKFVEKKKMKQGHLNVFEITLLA